MRRSRRAAGGLVEALTLVGIVLAGAGCSGDDAPRSSGTSSSGTGSGGAGGAGAGGAGGGGAGGAGGTGGAATTVPSFGDPVALSHPALAAFVPSVAARSGQCLVAWHEFSNGAARVAYSLVVAGVPGAPALIADPFGGPKRPKVATTKAGYVIAYQASDGTADVVRAVELDDQGAVVAGPDPISTPGVSAAMPHLATAGDEEAFAWTDGAQHFFALRGPLETAPPTAVGTTLLSQGLLNFPRIALAPGGDLFLSYRDGGVDTTTWDTLLVVRPKGGAFGAPVNVSKSPGLLSDDIDVTLEADGTLDLAWVDQNGDDVNAFEVVHATRSPSGDVGAPVRYGTQDLWAWTPSVVPGLAAVWFATTGTKGPFYYGAPGLPPAHILGNAIGNAPSLARGPDGVLHLAYTDDSMPARVEYVEGS